jgi:ATP dependent DNA ligase domain
MKQDVASSFSFIQTMMALRVRELPVGHWLYELKFDGYRALAFKAGKEARLDSRNQINFGNDYPQLIDALKLLTAKNVVIDACLVPSCRLEQKHTLNSKPLSFLCMGNRLARRAPTPAMSAILPRQVSTAVRITWTNSGGVSEKNSPRAPAANSALAP